MQKRQRRDISKLSPKQLRCSLSSKRFCGFSEQRKTEERDFDNFAAQEMGTSEKWSEGGGRNCGTKNGVGGRGEEGKEMLASKYRYFEKPRLPANGEISASDWCGI